LGAPTHNAKTRALVKGKRRAIVQSHFEKYLPCPALKGFAGGGSNKTCSEPLAARDAPRAERLNFRFAAGKLNEYEGLQVSLSLTREKNEGSGPLQETAERFRIPRVLEASFVQGG